MDSAELEQQINAERASYSQQLDEQIAEQKALNERTRLLGEKQAAERKPLYEAESRAGADVAAAAANPPRLMKPAAPPNISEMTAPTNMQKTFGMSAIFALLAAGITKDKSLAGLNAIGGFMKGAREGNWERAEAAMKDFNNNMAYTVKTNEVVQRDYLNILESKKLTLDQKERDLRMKMLEHKDEFWVKELEQKGMTAVHGLMADRAKINREMSAELRQTKQLEAQMTHWKMIDARARAGIGGAGGAALDVTNLPPPEPGKKNEALLAKLPPAEAELVKRMANYDLPATGFGGLDIKTRSKLVQLATLYDPDFNAAEYLKRSQTRLEYSPRGATGQNILALNTMTHHMHDFAEAYGSLNNSQIQTWNSSKNRLRTEFGDPALQRVQVSALAVAGELAKVVKGGRAAPTDQEMKHWEEVFGTSMSKRQMEAVVWQALKTAGGRLAAIEQGYSENMGGAKANALYPETKQLIAQHKPVKEKAPNWLSGDVSDLSDLEKKAQLSGEEKIRISSEQRRKAGLQPYPAARNPKTGEWLIYKDSQWQKP